MENEQQSKTENTQPINKAQANQHKGNNDHKVQRMVGTGVLTALVILLQIVGGSIHFGPFTITLALIPIIIGAILYGVLAGTFLGLVFGVVVTIYAITGAEPTSLVMFQFNPVMTVLVCLVKGAAAGFLAGLLYKIFSRIKPFLAVVLAAVIAPIANTGLFCIAMLTIFRSILEQSALAAAEAGTGANVDNLAFFLIGLIGANFLFELLFDIVLIPILDRIIRIVQKRRS